MTNNQLFLWRKRLRIWLFVVMAFTLSVLITGCMQAIAPMGSWESELYANHPLVGKIWDSNTGSFIDEDELFTAITNSQYVLLGEKHDNPDHHWLQLDLLNQLLDSNKLDSVSMEMIDSSSDDLLQTIQQQDFNSLDELKNYLEWDEEGWDWPFYGPLILDSLQAGIVVRSANISNQRVGEIYGQPLDQGVASVLDAAAIEQLNEEIDASHCNLLPASQFPAMVSIQQARDHQMALSLTDGRSAVVSGKIRLLVAGNYHVRQDLSVPNYIMALDPSTTRDQIIALALLEVSPESNNPVDYMQAYSNTSPFDYIWFTPSISNEDYCASLRQ
jgi:uncharacterized iron-regulated protein